MQEERKESSLGWLRIGTETMEKQKTAAAQSGIGKNSRMPPPFAFDLRTHFIKRVQTGE